MGLDRMFHLYYKILLVSCFFFLFSIVSLDFIIAYLLYLHKMDAIIDAAFSKISISKSTESTLSKLHVTV